MQGKEKREKEKRVAQRLAMVREYVAKKDRAFRDGENVREGAFGAPFFDRLILII